VRENIVIKTVGIIGSGNIGSAVARLAVAAGLEVVLSNSRGPESLAGLVTDLGDLARATTPAEAARAGDVVVTAIPLGAYTALPAADLAEKTVIDTMVYYPERDGHLAELDSGALTSSALIQRHLTGSHVVKTFNNVDFLRLFTLARPLGATDRSALPLAGDDAAAKTRVSALVDALGYDPVDIGTLAESWRCAPGTPLHVHPYLPARPPGQMTQEKSYRWFMEATGTPVPAAQVKHLADTAVRVPAGEARATLG
jgi:predicted dinucleotide-binding enzyme